MATVKDEPDGATELEAEEREGLKFRHVTTRGQLDHLEQANIQDGLKWLSKRRSGEILDERFVRELHKRMFGQVWTWAGSFRSTEKNIGIDPRQISVQLRMLLDDVKYWVEHETYPPLEACLRFHHRLVYIHLFANGNGRHARIMTDALMAKVFKGKPIDWAGGYDLQSMNERRAEYIQVLRQADRGDYSALLRFSVEKED
jgi:Fic-DOC domain mobile mystery protein B